LISFNQQKYLLQQRLKMANPQPKKVIVVGGSLGGLFTGIVFVRLGYDVTILERTLASALQDQGAPESHSS
jgi:pyruvate/2-oxoglutarate dehydrogenase complex dihydrolipoamide dehydrogenase (E3) component